MSGDGGHTAAGGRDRSGDAIEHLAAEWDALADATGSVPWLRPGWAAAWWRAFGRGRLEVVTVRDGERLVAVAPFARRGGELRSNVNYHTPAFAPLAADHAAGQRILADLFDRTPRRLSILFVSHTPGALEPYREAAAEAGYLAHVRTLERSPYVPIAPGDGRSLEDRLDGRVVRELRRRRRRLGEAGRLEVVVEDGHERLDALLSDGFAVEAASWKGARGTAITSRPETAGFYRDVARWAAARGWLRLAFLRLDGRAIAFDFAIECDRVHYLLKTGYDPAWRRDAPGMLLRQAMLGRAIEAGLASYEFLGRDEPWKLVWTRHVRERVGFQAFRPSPLGRLDWWVQAHARTLARTVRAAARAHTHAVTAR